MRSTKFAIAAGSLRHNRVMQVFELHYPGAWLEGVPDPKQRSQLLGLLHHLESQLADAAIGLACFDAALAMSRSEPGRIRRGAAARIVGQAIESELPATLTREERWAASREIPEAADLQVRRDEWAAGRMPDGYQFRLPFLYAHTVLYALDTISKTVEVLADMELPQGVADASHAFSAALPDLVQVRNSAHHMEDRARGLDSRRKPLVLQPIDNGAISAPSGGALALSNLNGNLLGYTVSDGRHGEVEISAASVAAARTAIQGVLDALSWSGSPRIVPN